MIRLLNSAVFVLAALALAACQQQDAGDQDAQAETPALDTPQQRLNYGVALGLGRSMLNDGMQVDVDAFALGLRDAIEGNEPRMTQDEIRAEVTAFQERASGMREAQASAMAQANAEAAQAFLAENAAREGVVTTESGLQYEVLEESDGASPGPDDRVQVHYRGTLLDGQQFDSSYDRGQPVVFGLGQVIPGWTEGLQLMTVGSKYKFFIPPELGYGAGGAGQMIGPNAALIFEVELLDIPSQQAEADDAAESPEG